MKTALALCLLVASAYADTTPTAELTLHNDGKTAPTVEAALINAPLASKMTLTTGTVTINASSKKAYAQSTDSLAIAFVIQSDEAFATANLAAIQKALDASGLVKACPPDSFGMVVSYSLDTQVKIAMGPLERLKGSNLGTVKDYKGKKGVSLAPAITLALSELDNVQTPRKVLVIIGDGSEPDAKAPLMDLKKQAAKQGIHMFAVVTKTGAVTKLVGNPMIAAKPTDLTTQIDALAKQLVERVYVTFILGKSVPLDGKVHDFVVGLDKLDLEPIALSLK